MEVTLSNEVKTKLNNAVDECVNSMYRIRAEKEFQKEVLARMKEEIDGFDAQTFNAVVAERFDSKTSDKVAKLEDSIALNEILIAHKRGSNTETTPPTGEDESE